MKEWKGVERLGRRREIWAGGIGRWPVAREGDKEEEKRKGEKKNEYFFNFPTKK